MKRLNRTGRLLLNNLNQAADDLYLADITLSNNYIGDSKSENDKIINEIRKPLKEFLEIFKDNNLRNKLEKVFTEIE